MPILIIFILILLLIYRPRIFAVISLILFLCLIIWLFYYEFIYVPPQEVFIQENNITITARQKPEIGQGMYAENSTHYFFLQPANYYEIAQDNNCPGFNKLNKETWCGEAGFMPSCYPEDRECSSIILTDEDGTF